ncbi:MAG: methyltransferase [Promethearchaeota archaeon]
MVNKKQVLFSFLLPIILGFIVPFLLVWLIERRSFLILWNQNLFFLIFGFVILGFGLALFIECNWLFYSIGRGTLVPITKIETRSMVIKGPYRYVRNPMIISVMIMLLAESLLFNSISILIYTGIFFIVNVIYMPLSEEKGLIVRFGDEFLHYKKNVRAWIPKLHSYSPSVYDLENPLIKEKKVNNPDVNAQIIAERLAYSIERGRQYKRAGLYIVRKVMDSGLVKCVEIQIFGIVTIQGIKKCSIKARSISKDSQTDQNNIDKGVSQCKIEIGTLKIIVKIKRLKFKRKIKYKITETLDFLDEESGEKSINDE